MYTTKVERRKHSNIFMKLIYVFLLKDIYISKLDFDMFILKQFVKPNFNDNLTMVQISVYNKTY